MRIERCKDTHGQRVRCQCCGAIVRLDVAYADLDGEPFKAYYCPDCVVGGCCVIADPAKM
jgi:hypothetical protein